jgi:metal-responsive CopG/Arc/MetJ family transcriptional regulator
MDTEKEKFNVTKYKNDFQKEKYDRIIVNVPKGQKEKIDSVAKNKGYKSLNSFVVDAINEKLEK